MVLDPRVLVRLTEPHGLVSHRNLVEAACTRSQLRNLVRTRRLRRLTRDVYSISPQTGLLLRVRALLRVLPPSAVASCATAAALYGVCLMEPDAPLEFAVPRQIDVAPRSGCSSAEPS